MMERCEETDSHPSQAETIPMETFDSTSHLGFSHSRHEIDQILPKRPVSHSVFLHSGDQDGEGPLLQQMENSRRHAVMTLSEKREKKAEIVRKKTIKSRKTTIGIGKMAKYRISMSWQKAKEAMKAIFYTLELWYSSLKLIEGNFGSGVVSYFKFLRWLFLLNLITFIISFSFLVFPQILDRIFVSVKDIPDVAKNGGTYTEKRFSDPSVSNDTVLPPLTAAALLQRSNPYGKNVEFSASDLFTGEGFLTDTCMYYGFYKNSSLELVEGYPYDVPNAYFFSMAVCYILILITVSVSMARSYRKTFIETRESQKSYLALKIFCGWDFSIATSEGAVLNKSRLYNEIKEALNEEDFKGHGQSCLKYCKTLIVQVSLNIMFLVVITGVALIMWQLMARHSAYLSIHSVDNSSTDISMMTMAIITSLIMNLLPKGFSWIIKYEDYQNPRTAMYVTLLRTFTLNVVVVGSLSVFWVTHSQECWETLLGQEVYRLFVADFIISVLLMGIVETLWSGIQRKFFKRRHRTEFDIAWNTLNLIYNQTLFLAGFYFSPLLSAVIVIKLFATFYIKKAGVLHNCHAPRRSWRAAHTQTVFLILTFLVLLGVFLGFGYIIFRVSPSNCGPFKGFPFMYEAILEKILQVPKGNMFWKAVMYLTKPGMVGGILIAMSIATYILRAQAQAHSIEAEILNNMLVNETKDKAFLFKSIKRMEERNRRRYGSPAISHSSSFHTPLSERRQMMRLSMERKQSALLLPNRSTGVANQRKFSSTSHLGIRDSSWSYGIVNPKNSVKGHRRSTSCGAKGVTCEFELSEIKHH